MAFFLVMRGHSKEYSFSYLTASSGPRIARTLVPGSNLIDKTNQETSVYYAIDLMNKKIHTMSPAKKLSDVEALMIEKKIHHVPLLIDNILTGLVSSTDVKDLLDENDKSERLSTIMTKTVLCVSESETIENILKVFSKENIRCLPVIDASMKLVGIITQNDIFNWILDQKLYLKD